MKKTNRMRNVKANIAAMLAAAGLAYLTMPISNAKAQEYTNAVIPSVTNNMKLTWNWATDYEVRANSAGNGTVTGNTNDWIQEGNAVNLEALANQYYDFSGWSNAPSGKEAENPLNYASDAPRTITANFTPELAPEYNTPLYWLTGQHGLADENADDDGDGMKNWQEYIADTDPTNGYSCFEINDLKEGNSMDLTIPNTSTSRVYYVDANTNLLDAGGWSYAGTNSVGNGSNLTFHLDINGERSKFYRARVGKN